MVFGKMNNLNVLYEDNHIIVVEKIPNILSQSDITGDKDLLSLVKEYVKEKYNKPGNVYIGLVHRLDRVVGGIMVFARTSKAASRLNEQIKSNKINKTYLALVKGIIKEKKGIFEDYIYKDEKSLLAKITDEKNGKYSKLEYEVIDYIDGNSLVKINLITGRYNQIRLQFSSRNHPLIGDKKYGIKDNKQIYLYAYKLEFIHPTTKELLSFKLLPKWKELENNETIIHRL